MNNLEEYFYIKIPYLNNHLPTINRSLSGKSLNNFRNSSYR
jgi:hypothetical protein